MEIANYIHDKQNTENSKIKIKEFQINQKVAVRNYTSVINLKIGRIIVKQGIAL